MLSDYIFTRISVITIAYYKSVECKTVSTLKIILKMTRPENDNVKNKMKFAPLLFLDYINQTLSTLFTNPGYV